MQTPNVTTEYYKLAKMTDVSHPSGVTADLLSRNVTADLLSRNLTADLLSRNLTADLVSRNGTDLYLDVDSILDYFHDSLYTHTQPRTILMITAYIPVFLLALGGNLLVILVIFTTRHMRSPSNYFLLNLSIADLLVTMVCIPLTVGEMVYKVWIYGTFLCKAAGYLQGVSVSASVLTILALSLERFLVIRYPVASRRISSLHILLCILLIWILSCCVMIPILVVRGLTLHPLSSDDDRPWHVCHEKWTRFQHRQALDIFLFVFIYVVPGVGVVALHSASGCHLLTTTNTGSDDLYRHGSVSQSSRVALSRRRAARMLVSLAILFAASWLPYHIVTLYTDFTSSHGSSDSHLLAMSVTLLLGHSNSAQNPVIYCLMNDNFRKGAKELLTCKTTASRNRSLRSDLSNSLKNSTVPATGATGGQHHSALTPRPSTDV